MDGCVGVLCIWVQPGSLLVLGEDGFKFKFAKIDVFDSESCNLAHIMTKYGIFRWFLAETTNLRV